MVQLTTENIKWLALTAVIAVAAIAVIGTGVLTGLSSDSIEITEASLKKGPNTNAVITFTIKNLSSGPVTLTTDKSLITGLPPAKYNDSSKDRAHVNLQATSGSIESGGTYSFSKSVNLTEGLKIGESYILQVSADSDTNVLTDTIVVYVTGI